MAQGTNPLKNVGARLRAAARDINELEAEYERSLRAKAVSETVQLGVDAVVHHQRSSLDYLANRLIEAAGLLQLWLTLLELWIMPRPRPVW